MTTKEEFEGRIEIEEDVDIQKLWIMIHEQKDAGKLEEAIETARRAIGPLDTAEMLCYIAPRQMEAGIDPAPLLKEAEELVSGIEEDLRRASGLLRIAQARNRVGMDASILFREAMEATKMARAQCDERTAVPDVCNFLFERIAVSQAKAHLFTDAAETASLIANSENRAKAISDIVLELTKAGTDILPVLKEALTLQKAREGEFQKPDLKKPISGQPLAEKAREKR